MTHLATGRLIVSGHGIPSHDPYSFTAHGAPWVVQSWLASVLYGWVDRFWGGQGLRVLMGLTTAALGAMTWRLTRPATDPARAHPDHRPGHRGRDRRVVPAAAC